MSPVCLTQGKYVLAQCLFLYAWLKQNWLFTNRWEKNKVEKWRGSLLCVKSGKGHLKMTSWKAPNFSSCYIGKIIRRENEVQLRYFWKNCTLWKIESSGQEFRGAGWDELARFSVPSLGQLNSVPKGGVGKEKQEGKMARTQVGFWMLAFFSPRILHFRNIFLVTQVRSSYNTELFYSSNSISVPCKYIDRHLGAGLWRIRPRKLLLFFMKCKWI